jgi:hypothetical protein
MQADAPIVAKAEISDSHITPIGKFLRRYSLDELPQLVNIIKGDMSIIGPRPVIPCEAIRIKHRTVSGVSRLRPGLTGLAQVKGRDHISDIKKSELDARYLKRFSLSQDTKIFFKTISIIFTAKHNQDNKYAKLDTTISVTPPRRKYTTCSVVLAVYKNDHPDWFRQSVESVLDQTIKSDDIVIVVDGPVPTELGKIVDIYDRLYPEITVKRLAKNLGAGAARNTGVRLAKNPLVAIQDADDISLPNRFELELTEFNKDSKLTLVGGQLAEFQNNDSTDIISYRHVPLTYTEIREFARRRMPVNGATVIFKKSPFLRQKGYGSSTRSEDYLLIAKFLWADHHILNIPEIIYLCRESSNSLRRRKSFSHTADFIRTRRQIYSLGINSYPDFLIPCIAQLTLSIFPVNFTHLVYKKLLRKRVTVAQGTLRERVS